MGTVLGLKGDMESLLPDSRNSVAITEEGSCVDDTSLNGGSTNMDAAQDEDVLEQRQTNKKKVETVKVVAELCELFGQIDSCGEGTVR